MDVVATVVAALGAIVLLLGLSSKWLERTPIPLSLLALLYGILLGPAGLGVVDLDALGERPRILEEIARIALGISLVGVALRVPREYPRGKWRTQLVLIGLGMPLMWLVSAGLIHLILGLPLWLAALIGAIVTPTDPIAAGPIVTGPAAEENLPERVRHALSFESGANDGLSYLLVFLPFLILTRPPEEALSHWVLHTLLWEVAFASVMGITMGFVAARLLQAAERRDMMEEDWRLVYTVALSLLALGTGRLLGSDELLVAFAAGAAFVQVVSQEDRKDEEKGQEAMNRFFALPIFAVLGTTIPWEGWLGLGWSGVLLAFSILLLRRPPVLLLLRPWLRDLRGVPDALFLGWFGPIAVAAIYYASIMEHQLGEPLVWEVTTLMIVASVLAHGTTAAPLTELYGKRTGERARLEAEKAAGRTSDGACEPAAQPG
jgi:sodium/hydrogen antiporter